MHTWLRHGIVIVVLAMLVLLFAWNRDLEGVHLWNRAFADAAVVLLYITLAIGPIVRLVPFAAPILPWRRETGIWFALASVAHVAIYATSFAFDVRRFFGGFLGQRFLFLDNPWAIGNWIGAIALGYAVVIALTSNDWSERFLGRGWKHLQQQSYTVFVLVAIHTAIFVYVAAKFGGSIFTTVFWIGIGTIVALQLAGYVYTVSRHVRRRDAAGAGTEPLGDGDRDLA